MISKILLPTDGSETAEAAVQFARDIALAEDASVIVLGVAHAVQYGDSTSYDPMPEIVADEQRYVDDDVAGLVAAGVKATGKVVNADQVYKAITETAEAEHADVIVMGTHGRTGLTRTVVGSVADRVVRHSDTPVVLVPLH